MVAKPKLTPTIRRDIRDWLNGAVCGHGAKLSKAAQRQWNRVLKVIKQ